MGGTYAFAHSQYVSPDRPQSANHYDLLYSNLAEKLASTMRQHDSTGGLLTPADAAQAAARRGKLRYDTNHKGLVGSLHPKLQPQPLTPLGPTETPAMAPVRPCAALTPRAAAAVA